MLIEFSYLLTRVEGKTGSPEKPLSDMGLVSYRNYWRRILCAHLLEQKESLSITDISDMTGMTADDIVCGLEGLRALVRDPVTKSYALRLDRAYFKNYLETYEKKAYNTIDPDALMWVPYVMGRDNSHYENAPIQTVKQRDEEPSMTLAQGSVDLAENDVSTKDFANRLALEMANSMSEADDGPATGALTPFPPLESALPSPSRKKITAVTPSTPFVNVSGSGDSPIPATRFEIFPPIPGTHKKKLGRPFGSFRASHRRGTPIRERPSLPASPSTGPRLAGLSNPASSRRTRSALTAIEATNGVAVNGEGTDVHANDGEMDVDSVPAEGTMEDAEGDFDDS